METTVVALAYTSASLLLPLMDTVAPLVFILGAEYNKYLFNGNYLLICWPCHTRIIIQLTFKSFIGLPWWLRE